MDGVRGVAVLLVVASHAGAERYEVAGGVGVAMFFALSGYLITRILLSELDERGRVDLRRFYARRAARLLPAVVAYAAAMLALGLALPAQAAATLTYVANVPSMLGWQMAALGHTWSLAVEEQFYLAFPATLLLIVRRERRWLPWLLVGAASVSLAVRFGLWSAGASAERIYHGTDTNAGLLLLGAAAGAWAAQSPRVESSRPRLTALLVLLAGALPLLFSDTTAAHTLLPVLGAVAGVGVVLSCSGSRWLATPVLTYLGRRSYGLYLWHFPLRWLLLPRLEEAPSWQLVLVLLGGGMVLAELSWRLVEQPSQRWVRSLDVRSPASENATVLRLRGPRGSPLLD